MKAAAFRGICRDYRPFVTGRQKRPAAVHRITTFPIFHGSKWLWCKPLGASLCVSDLGAKLDAVKTSPCCALVAHGSCRYFESPVVYRLTPYKPVVNRGIRRFGVPQHR